MESLRIVDEWTLIEGKITLDTVFRKKTDDVSELAEEERDILFLVDGENDVSTIIDISGKDDFAVSKTLLSLLENGIIERKETVPVSTDLYPAQVKKTFIYNQNLPVFAIAVAVVLSLVTVFFEPHNVFQRFRASEAVDDLRFRIAAHKFEHGAYPADLLTIDHRSDPWGNQYIYRPGENSFLVLSAGPDGKEGTADDVY
jgi:hypothetical protein